MTTYRVVSSYTCHGVVSSYTCHGDADIELPEGKTWDDVKSWYIKWDVLHIQFKENGEYEEFRLDSSTSDGIDWKRPSYVAIYPVDEDGDADFNNAVEDGDYS